MQTGRAYCDHCKSWVKAEAATLNHLLHVIGISVACLMFFLAPFPVNFFGMVITPLWLGLWLFFSFNVNWRCADCGSPAYRRPPKPKPKLRREIAAEVTKTIVKPKPTVTEKPTSGKPMARGVGKGGV